MQSAGSDGLEGLKAALKDDEVQFAAFKVAAVDNVGRRSRFVALTWAGSRLSPMMRMKVLMARGAVSVLVFSCSLFL